MNTCNSLTKISGMTYQQAKDDCCDYSQAFANTGAETISEGNSNLNGSGSITQILLAGGNGTVIRSITIKAVEATTQGMVRLFFQTGGSDTYLFREIQIPAITPSNVVPTFEITLFGNINLNPGYKLFASTEKSEPFNIIVEGLDWRYPESIDCCDRVNTLANTGLGMLDTRNLNRDGSGTIIRILTAQNDGTELRSAIIKATNTTSEGMVRIFVSKGGENPYLLFKEIHIPSEQCTDIETAYEQSFIWGFRLQNSYEVAASTVNSESFNVIVEGLDWSYPIS